MNEFQSDGTVPSPRQTKKQANKQVNKPNLSQAINQSTQLHDHSHAARELTTLMNERLCVS